MGPAADADGRGADLQASLGKAIRDLGELEV
jgi:hypothetical protein